MYRVLISIEVLQLDRPSRRERDAILSFLEGLKSNPGQPGDYPELDASGRTVQIKILGAYALTYWVDHAVREVKVVKVEKAD